MSVYVQTASGGGSAGVRSLPWIIGASSVGTLVEWYDFYIYGVLAVFFAQHFFPPGNPGLAFLASLAVFWFGFIARPFGAVFFGYLGDLIGRKFTFMLTLSLMGLATFLVGLLPTYATLGVAAPVLLLIIRAVQGLALGGEYGGAATYIAEPAPDGKRGLYTSWIQTTATMGIVAALLVILICRLSMGDAAFTDWGWRIPFLLSAILVALSAYIRLKLEESPLFARLKEQGKTSKNPAAESFLSGSKNWRLILIALFGATAPEGVVWYTGQFYALFYMTTVLKIPLVTVYVVLNGGADRGLDFLCCLRLVVRSHRSPQYHDVGLRPRGRDLLAGFYLARDLQRQSGDADHPGVLPRDPGPHGLRSDRGFPRRALPGADPLQLAFVTLSYRQRVVRRRRAGHWHGACADDRHCAERPLLSDGDRGSGRDRQPCRNPRADAQD